MILCGRGARRVYGSQAGASLMKFGQSALNHLLRD